MGITTLSTSLHDTMVEGMNEGFKTTSELLKNLQGEHGSVIRALKDLVDVIQSDIPAEMKIAAITVIVILIILQSGMREISGHLTWVRWKRQLRRNVPTEQRQPGENNSSVYVIFVSSISPTYFGLLFLIVDG